MAKKNKKSTENAIKQSEIDEGRLSLYKACIYARLSLEDTLCQIKDLELTNKLELENEYNA